MTTTFNRHHTFTGPAEHVTALAVLFPSGGPAIGPSLRILLADDEFASRKAAEALLFRAGHRVIAVTDGRKAVATLRRSDFDVVLMDVEMPILDGLAAARRIRELPTPKRDVPIIALAGPFASVDRDRYRAAGVNDWTRKPVRLNDLFQALERVLDPEDETAAEAALDPARLADLEAVLPRAAVIDLLEMFAVSARAALDQLRQFSAESDLAACGRAAHGLAGMAGNVGALETARLARVAMAACRSQDIAAMCRSVNRLDRAVTAAEQAVRGWIVGDDAGSSV
jgi:CheY-like chemotaxis protein/HPt (histidine-containing phosphotransfer) domain-containing protein